jgi:hypothetical protein
MIKIPNEAVISSRINNKTCFTAYVTNCHKLPLEILQEISRKSLMMDINSYSPDMIFVCGFEDSNVWEFLIKSSDFHRIIS